MKHHVPTRSAIRIATLAAFAVLLAACGGGDEAGDKVTVKKPAGKRAADTAAPVNAAAAEKQLANAVVTGKTTTPVDLKYDVLAKPDVGQPFEVELTFLPRLPADALEVEVTGMPGLTVVSGGAAKFEPVQAGGRDVLKVVTRGDEPGLYYLSVLARMVTKVQTEFLCVHQRIAGVLLVAAGRERVERQRIDVRHGVLFLDEHTEDAGLQR